MDNPILYVINDIKLYLANDLQSIDSGYFYGCNKTVRQIISKKNIPDDVIYYATLSKNG